MGSPNNTWPLSIGISAISAPTAEPSSCSSRCRRRRFVFSSSSSSSWDCAVWFCLLIPLRFAFSSRFFFLSLLLLLHSFSPSFSAYKIFPLPEEKNYTQNVSPPNHCSTCCEGCEEGICGCPSSGIRYVCFNLEWFCAIEIVLLTWIVRHRWYHRIDGLPSCMTTTHTHPIEPAILTLQQDRYYYEAIDEQPD